MRTLFNSGLSKKIASGGYASDPRLSRLTDSKFGAGSKSWGILHLMALDGALNRDTLHAFITRIGCQKCRRSFEEIISKVILESSSPAEAFDWTVRVHNLVNQKLGKAGMSLAEAFNRWACLGEDGGGTCKIQPTGGSCMCG